MQTLESCKNQGSHPVLLLRAVWLRCKLSALRRLCFFTSVFIKVMMFSLKNRCCIPWVSDHSAGHVMLEFKVVCFCQCEESIGNQTLPGRQHCFGSVLNYVCLYFQPPSRPGATYMVFIFRSKIPVLALNHICSLFVTM